MSTTPKQQTLKIRAGLDQKVVELAERLRINPNHFANECLQAIVEALENPEVDVPPLIPFYRRALGKMDQSFWFRFFDRTNQFLTIPGQLVVWGRRIKPQEVEACRELWNELLPCYATALVPQQPSEWMRATSLANLRAGGEILGKNVLEKLNLDVPRLNEKEKLALDTHEPEIASVIQKFKRLRKLS